MSSLLLNMPDVVVIALAFAAIFVVELPDKTFLATLVLSTKYRPGLVWLGVGAAFGVQTLIAVALGKAASLLPTTWVQLAAACMFLLGAIMLVREARGHDEDDEEDFGGDAKQVHGFRVVVTCFLVLFAAEWGDLSQLLTLSLVARYDDPVSVFIGAWAALLTVSGLAILVGRVLLAKVRLSLLHYVGAAVCLALAAFTLYEVLA